MAILRLHHLGVAVRDVEDAATRFGQIFGFEMPDFRTDPTTGRGDAKLLLGNGCYLHLMQRQRPGHRLTHWVREHGDGLEHIALETDDIEADVAHLRRLGVGIHEDRILDEPNSYETFIFPDQPPGVRIELVQQKPDGWAPPECLPRVSRWTGVRQLHHVGVGVHNREATCAWFERLFGLQASHFRDGQSKGMQNDARIMFPNDCWLHICQNWNPQHRLNQFVREHGEGPEHIALETTTVEADAQHFRDLGLQLYRDKVFTPDDGADGYELFLMRDQAPIMVEVIQPM
ncbi:MAG: hypothetical protein GX605_04260 [Chloroflexi bacterium]|nr:hypothetical protein [Chloroflexota bacterium]